MLLVCLVCALFVVALLVLWHFVHSARRSSSVEFAGSHILITGGSSGIGKSLALALAKVGAHVTLVARNEERLKNAVAAVQESCLPGKKQRVNYISLDLSSDFESIKTTFKEAEGRFGEIDILFNCAGYSLCGTFSQLSMVDFKEMINVNYLGSVAMTKCVVDGMMRRRSGHIVLVSSIAGQFGLYGYAAYSPSKFAIRGLAETLSAELHPHDVGVSIVFPPDTDTPGFEQENKQKPDVTKEISASGMLFTPDQVAETILNGVQRNQFAITCGFDGFIVGTLTSGCSPASSLAELLVQALLMSPVRLLWSFYLYSFSNIALKHSNSKKTKAE